jgi:hypothetical protein
MPIFLKASLVLQLNYFLCLKDSDSRYSAVIKQFLKAASTYLYQRVIERRPDNFSQFFL